MLHPALTIFDKRAKDYLHTDFEIKVLNADCAFSEGPLWNNQGYYLFSDIPRNVICSINETGNKNVVLNNSGCILKNKDHLSEHIGSNGLGYDKEGNVLICQHGNGAVSKWDGQNNTSFISSYNGKRFNSPNDIVVHPNGSVFFSDPPYGLKEKKLAPVIAQPVAGIYCYNNETTELVTDKFQYPNGLCLSPDGKKLYCCSNKSFERFILEIDAETLQIKHTTCNENGDGIKCDMYGNLWLCTKEGILILNKDGERLALIAIPTIPANCCWGGPHGRDLFITARENIFLIHDLLKQS
jgi:gluconolactonase